MEILYNQDILGTEQKNPNYEFFIKNIKIIFKFVVYAEYFRIELFNYE
jgi:hypothetical protein